MEQQELTNKVLVTMKHFASFMGNDYGVTDVWANGSNVHIQRRDLLMTLSIVYDVWNEGYVIRDLCNFSNSDTVAFLSATAQDFYKLRDIAHEVEKNEKRFVKRVKLFTELSNFAYQFAKDKGYECEVTKDQRFHFYTFEWHDSERIKQDLVTFWINFECNTPFLDGIVNYDPDCAEGDKLAQEVNYVYNHLEAQMYKLVK